MHTADFKVLLNTYMSLIGKKSTQRVNTLSNPMNDKQNKLLCGVC